MQGTALRGWYLNVAYPCIALLVCDTPPSDLIWLIHVQTKLGTWRGEEYRTQKVTFTWVKPREFGLAFPWSFHNLTIQNFSLLLAKATESWLHAPHPLWGSRENFFLFCFVFVFGIESKYRTRIEQVWKFFSEKLCSYGHQSCKTGHKCSSITES